MTPHGIHSTKADYWIHLHPLSPGFVYWYAVPLLREYIAIQNIIETDGRSKNGATTGRGYLIPKRCPVVEAEMVPPRYLDWFDWQNATDRERGRRGEMVVGALIERGIVKIPVQRVQLCRTPEEQNEGYDGIVLCFADAKWEAKTECVNSGNLFVQTAERGHEPNLIRLGDSVERRETLLAPYDANKDLAGSIVEGFRAIRERMANGGPGWEPK